MFISEDIEINIYILYIHAILGFTPAMLFSPFDCDMQPPDPSLLIGNPISESSLSPAPQPIPPVTAAAQAGAFSKTALGVVLGVGIPLTLGMGMFVHHTYHVL